MAARLPSPRLCVSLVLAACWAPQLAPAGPGDAPADPGALGDLQFVADGVILPGEVGARGLDPATVVLAEGRLLVPLTWQAGQTISLIGGHQRVSAIAPAQPSCVLLFRVGVGSRQPTSLRFSDDGSALVIDRPGRDALVVDGWRGQDLGATPLAQPGLVLASEALPPRCPAESLTGDAVVGPDHRLAVVEGPFIEASGETGWRVAVFR